MKILLAAIYPYAFLLLYLTIPFDNYIRALPNILVAILIVAFPFIVKKEDFKKLKSIPIALFLAFFAYLCINSLIHGRFQEDFTVINKVLLILGLAVLYIPVHDPKKINSAIIFSALAAIAFTVYNFVVITDQSGNVAFGDSPPIVESLLIDRLYLGLLCTLSILISFQEIRKKYHPENNYYLANIFVNILFLVLIDSKIAGIALFVLILLRQFYGQRKIWKMAIAVGAIVAVVGIFFVISNQIEKENNTVETLDSNSNFIENSMTYEIRAVVWKCAAALIKEEGFTLTGMGFKTSRNSLVASYQDNISDIQKRDRFVSERYNSHNQFLDIYLSAGFLALLLFLAVVGLSFFAVREQFFPTAMITLLILYCMLENIFHRQIGAYYIGFILITLMSSLASTEKQ